MGQWQHSLLGIMRGIGMLLVGTMVGMGTTLDLGYGGLPGQRTPRTGSVWPPYPGANQGFWARQAGFYNSLPNFSMLTKSSPSLPATSRLYQTPSVTPTIRTSTFPTSATLRTDSVGTRLSLPTLYRH